MNKITDSIPAALRFAWIFGGRYLLAAALVSAPIYVALIMWLRSLDPVSQRIGAELLIMIAMQTVIGLIVAFGIVRAHLRRHATIADALVNADEMEERMTLPDLYSAFFTAFNRKVE